MNGTPLDYEFGAFRLLVAHEQLFVGQAEVPLGYRAMRILALLVARGGEVVQHDELIRHGWPSTVVEDNNLRVQITTIRKTLRHHEPDADYIRNVPGRGYRFVARDRAVMVAEAPDDRLDAARGVASRPPERQADEPGQAGPLARPRRSAPGRVASVREGYIGQAKRFLSAASHTVRPLRRIGPKPGRQPAASDLHRDALAPFSAV